MGAPLANPSLPPGGGLQQGLRQAYGPAIALIEKYDFFFWTGGLTHWI